MSNETLGKHLPATFEQLVGDVRVAVEARLEQKLDELVDDAARYDVAPTAEAMRDLVLRGGKRFRAVMTVIGYCGSRPNVSWRPAIDAGGSIELLHAYLLAQDDWMDGDDTRRGGPAVHRMLEQAYGDARLGAASAILSSDMGWGAALEMLASAEVSAARRIAAIGVLARIHQDVILGQQIDMLADRESVEVIHELKTASYTVFGPLAMGASLAGVDAKGLETLRRFSSPLGVAFQLRDDLLGTFAPSRTTGKGLAGDLRRGKRTAVTVLAKARLDNKGKRAFRRVFGRDDASERSLMTAARHLVRCGVHEEVHGRLVELTKQASRRVRYVPLSPQGKQWLKQAAVHMRQSVPKLETVE